MLGSTTGVALNHGTGGVHEIPTLALANNHLENLHCSILSFYGISLAWGSDIRTLKMHTKRTPSKTFFVTYATSQMSDLSVKPTRRSVKNIYRNVKPTKLVGKARLALAGMQQTIAHPVA